MQDNILGKFAKLVVKVTQKGILRALYCLHCLRRFYQKTQPGKQLPVFLVILLFTFFSFQQIKSYTETISLLPQSENNNQKIHFQTIEKEEKKDDFQIASLIREEEPNLKIAFALNDTAFVAGNNVIEGEIVPTRTEVETYIVQPNDNPWDIAERYGLNVYTVLWANNLTYWRSNIKPGDELIILPIDGILHKIKNNEKLSQIAKKYKAQIEEIVEINKIKDPHSLTVGQEIIIPNGSPLPVAPAPAPAPKPVTPKTITPAPLLVTETSDCNYSDWRNKSCAPNCHRYYWQPGQCTDWVAYKWATELGQCVPPTWGNARTWLQNARNSGYQTGLTLRPGDEGSIVVLKCNNWYGHVAYIESFDENYIYISEMNGPSNPSWTQKPAPRTLRRTTAWQNTSQGGWQILGYIYPRK